MLGGYDDNLSAGLGTGAGLAPAAAVSGSTGNLETTLAYNRSNSLHSLRVDSTGTLLAYPAYLDGPAAGGAVAIAGKTTVGRNTTISASERVAYEPLFNVFSTGASSAPAGPGPVAPGTDQTGPVTGLFERGSLSSSTLLSLGNRWSKLNSTTLSYGYDVRQFTDDDYGDSTSHAVRTGYRRTLATGLRVGADYGYTTLRYAAGAGAPPSSRNHRMEGTAEIEHELSRHRPLTVSLAAGASYIDATASPDRQPYAAWLPTGSGTAKLTISPNWFLEGAYRREFSLLQGITNEVYTTDTGSLATGGHVTARTDVRVGATYATWKAPIAAAGIDTFDVYGASMQVRVLLTHAVAATAGYYYYHHRFSNPGGLPAGFPAEFGRNAIRFGITVRVPLMGRSAPPGRTQR